LGKFSKNSSHGVGSPENKPTKMTTTWLALSSRIVSAHSGGVRSDSGKYLAVIFDRSLRFRDHTEHCIVLYITQLVNTRKGLSALQVLSATKVDQKLLLLLYRDLILSPLEYLFDLLTVGKTHPEQLERIQNEATSGILGYTRDTCLSDLRIGEELIDTLPGTSNYTNVNHWTEGVENRILLP
jgi:hypothetical protein